MADPLSITASIITIVQLAGSLAAFCVSCKEATKGKHGIVQSILEEVEGLTDVLGPLAQLAKDHGAETQSLRRLATAGGPLDDCKGLLEVLKTELESLLGAEGAKKLGKILLWPIKEKEIKSLLERLSQRKSTLALAFQNVQIELTQGLQVRIGAVGDLLVSADVDGKRNKVLLWLNSADPSISHAEACKKRQPDTGLWFLASSEYSAWKTHPASLIWLHGIPGSGKSILCSTIIEDLLADASSSSGVAVAFFYFDYSDTDRQSVKSLTNSLLGQLCKQLPELPHCVKVLFERHEAGEQQSREKDLRAALALVIESFPQVYLALDALDECTEREYLMQFLDELLSLNITGLHLLSTSREERDIELGFCDHQPVKVGLEEEQVNGDIKLHIRSRLTKDLRLKRLAEPIKAEIEVVLLDGAKGMFLWVVRQLEALRQCTKPATVKRALTSLPKDLDETYNRILLQIAGDDERYKDAMVVLQWLAVAVRPPTLYEVAEVIAISPGCAVIDEDNRLFDATELLSICSGLIILVGDSETGRLRLTHFSVKEYLLSARIRTSPASAFALDEIDAHKFVAQVCITYLLSFDKDDVFMASELNDVDEHKSSEAEAPSLNPTDVARPTKKVIMAPKLIFRTFPLLRYAARYWAKHVRVLPFHEGAKLNGSIEDLFDTTKSASCLNWLRASDPARWGRYNFAMKSRELQQPLYYAAILGLATVVHALLTKDANVDYVYSSLSGYALRCPLHVAIVRGHDSVVRLLLSHGADIHTEDGFSRTPLQVACDYGRFKTAKLLLEEGADVNWPVNSLPEHDALPLQAAASHHDERLIKLLLDKGADIDAQSGAYGNALQHACYQGDQKIVDLLIDRGASVNAYGGFYHSPLQAAAALGYEAICRILINRGADVNATGGEYGSALQAACTRTRTENIARLLIANSADVNGQGGRYGTPLNAACANNCESIIKLLLDNGADINLDDLGQGTPLQSAAARGNEARFLQFLEMGADLEASNGNNGSSLQAAVACEDDTLVDLILSKGARVNSAASGRLGFPLQAAALTGNIPIAKKLLHVGSDVNASGGKYGSALTAAAFGGHHDMAQLLLEHGADVHAIGGKYGTALFAAAFVGRLEMVRFLLENGADATMSTYAGNPAGAAIKGWLGPHESVVELLELHGATDALMPADYAEHDELDTDVEFPSSDEGDYFDTESADLSGEER